MKSLVAATLLLATTTTVAAEETPDQSQAEAGPMQPIAWMVGEWRGEGWVMTRAGARENFRSHESVTPRISGNALLIEGRHWAADDPAQIVHDAIALLTFDRKSGTWRFHTALSSGTGGDYPAQPTASGLDWTIDTPGGRIDYVIVHEAGTWIERGCITAPGAKQVQFFEMRLVRAGR